MPATGAAKDAREYRIEAEACIRCAGCVTLAPELFSLGARAARLHRQPASREEVERCRVASLHCPTGAIVADRSGSIAIDARSDGDEAVVESVAVTAERARWRWDDVPWEALDRSRVPSDLVALVRESAFSELTTFTASRRFLDDFADDVEFSEWIVVWLYEESRHPQGLLRWLRAFGVGLDDEEVRRGRIVAPFLKSPLGTLVTNVVSEMIAAARYLSLSRHAPEETLRVLSRCIAADEARHGATFHRFARRRFLASADRGVEQLQAIKVLHFWLDERGAVAHPVHLLGERASENADAATALARMELPWAALRQRIARAVGALVDVPIDDPDDLGNALRRLASAARSERAEEKSR